MYVYSTAATRSIIRALERRGAKCVTHRPPPRLPPHFNAPTRNTRITTCTTMYTRRHDEYATNSERADSNANNACARSAGSTRPAAFHDHRPGPNRCPPKRREDHRLQRGPVCSIEQQDNDHGAPTAGIPVTNARRVNTIEQHGRSAGLQASPTRRVRRSAQRCITARPSAKMSRNKDQQKQYRASTITAYHLQHQHQFPQAGAFSGHIICTITTRPSPPPCTYIQVIEHAFHSSDLCRKNDRRYIYVPCTPPVRRLYRHHAQRLTVRGRGARYLHHHHLRRLLNNAHEDENRFTMRHDHENTITNCTNSKSQHVQHVQRHLPQKSISMA